MWCLCRCVSSTSWTCFCCFRYQSMQRVVASFARAAVAVRTAAAPGAVAAVTSTPATASVTRTAVRAMHATAPSFSAQLSSHRVDETNTEDMHFDFNEENYERVRTILGKYPQNYKQSGILPLLDLAQRQVGNFLPLAAMNKVAEICEVPPMRVYEVAAFYTMFNREKVGKYFIQLCGTTPCMVCGSEEIKNTITDYLGIHDGQTTKDGMFTLLEVECLGACVNAPMVQINDDFYECLTPETTIEILKSCQEDKPLPMKTWGSRPMNGQDSCEGPQGQTTLLGDITGPQCREFTGDKVDPASVKAHMLY